MNQTKPHSPRSREEINSLIEEWKASRLSKKMFAASKGINYMTFIAGLIFGQLSP